MDITNAKRAEVLVHALPYIQEYTGKIVVIKYGGNAMINEELKDSVMMDIVLLSLIGVRVVLVHGGGPEITDMLKKIGKESVFVDGLRVTDRETADTVQMVLAGKVNKSLVARIENKGGNAIGLSGMDADSWERSQRSMLPRFWTSSTRATFPWFPPWGVTGRETSTTSTPTLRRQGLRANCGRKA